MADAEKSTGAAAQVLIDLLYAEPVRASTGRSGILLSVFSFIAIAAIVLNLRLANIPMLGVVFAAESQQFQMLCMVLVFGLTIDFLFKASLEILYKREIDLAIEHQIQAARVKLLEAQAKDIDDQVYPNLEDENDPEPWWESVGTARKSAAEKFSALESKIGERTAPLRVRNIRFWFSIAYPISLSVLANYIGASLLVSFFKSLCASL